MSDNINNFLAPPPARAKRVTRPAVTFTRWEHQVEENEDWRASLTREYWLGVCDKLRPGDSIEVHSHDHAIVYEIRIIDVNTASDPTFLDLIYLPIHPRDLELPQPAPQVPPRYAVRMAPGGMGAFRVIDMMTGRVVHANQLDRHRAMELCSELERGLATSGAQVAVAFARQLAEQPAPTRAEKNRERTRKWREARRAAAAEAAAAQGGAA